VLVPTDYIYGFDLEFSLIHFTSFSSILQWKFPKLEIGCELKVACKVARVLSSSTAGMKTFLPICLLVVCLLIVRLHVCAGDNIHRTIGGR
jgi:hypothetical protein